MKSEWTFRGGIHYENSEEFLVMKSVEDFSGGSKIEGFQRRKSEEDFAGWNDIAERIQRRKQE